MCLNFTIYKCLIPNEAIMHNFHPLEVVCRSSETHLQVGENYALEVVSRYCDTQLQVGENLNKLT